MGEEQLLRKLHKHLEKVFGNNLTYHLAPEAYLGGYFLTILHPQADKKNGLKRLKEYLGESISEITVFGDNINDLGMFSQAHISVAVANAIDEVKNAATIVLDQTNDEDGVAYYLEKKHFNFF
jgi:hydroxymethylpyrimidine pyrophosphatase-like HAD family hydrolase